MLRLVIARERGCVDGVPAAVEHEADHDRETEQDPERPNPTFIPAADAVARWWEKRTGGLAQGGLTEAIFNIPTTAHILGGAVIGPDAETGVVDGDNRVYGYENLLVCDGAAVPANPGVNPSLTITALAERAMSRVPAKEDATGEAPPRGRPVTSGVSSSA